MGVRGGARPGAGRPRKPLEWHLLRGTYRQKRHGPLPPGLSRGAWGGVHGGGAGPSAGDSRRCRTGWRRVWVRLASASSWRSWLAYAFAPPEVEIEPLRQCASTGASHPGNCSTKPPASGRE